MWAASFPKLSSGSMDEFISLCICNRTSCLESLPLRSLPGRVTQVNSFFYKLFELGCFTRVAKVKLAHADFHLFLSFLKKIFIFAFVFERHNSQRIPDCFAPVVDVFEFLVSVVSEKTAVLLHAFCWHLAMPKCALFP